MHASCFAIWSSPEGVGDLRYHFQVHGNQQVIINGFMDPEKLAFGNNQIYLTIDSKTQLMQPYFSTNF